MLIADPDSGHGEELSRDYYAAAGQPKALWEIPGAGHVGGDHVARRGVRAPRDRVPRPAPRAMTGEARVFTGATALLLLHAMDDAFVHRGAGTGLGQHALAAVVSAAAGVGAVFAFERVRPGLRAFLAFAFGGLGARQRRACISPTSRPTAPPAAT